MATVTQEASPEVTEDVTSRGERVTVVEARPGWQAVNLREMWRYRDLAWHMAKRDFQVRYKQSLLGMLWAVLTPVSTMLVFSVLFGVLLGRGNEPSPAGVPYAISTFCALLPWQLFASSLTTSSASLVQAQGIITKVYFPRLIVPIAPLLVSMIDFAIAFAVLVLMIVGYHFIDQTDTARGLVDYRFTFHWGLLLLPLLVMYAVIAALSLSTWMAASAAIYRDVRLLVPFIIQIGMYLTPVVWSVSSVAEKLPDWAVVLLWLNPMTGVVETFRWSILGTEAPPWHLVGLSFAVVVAMLVGGMFYFRRIELTIADRI